MFRSMKSAMKWGFRCAAPCVLIASLALPAAAQPPADGGPASAPAPGERQMPPPRDYNSSSDFPSQELHAAVEANAHLVYARANYRRMQYSLDHAIRKLQYDFEHSHDLADATKAEQQAWDDYVAARTAALKKVSGDDNYKANVALRDSMGEQIRKVHEMNGTDKHQCEIVNAATMKQLVLMATVKLDYAQVATDMEISALRGDSKVADARGKLMSAGAKVAALRDDFDRSVRDNTQLASIRDKIEDARVQLITSEAIQAGAADVAAYALDYAYYNKQINFSYPLGYVSPYGATYVSGIYRY